MSFVLASLLINALFSLLCAWAFAALAVRVGRPGPGLAKWLLVVPFAKLVLDGAAYFGADNAFVRSLYIGSRLDQGRFNVGLALKAPLLPQLNGLLDARIGERWYALSVGELVAHGLARHVGLWALSLLLVGLLGVSVLRLVRRLVVTVRFERARRRERAHAQSLARVSLFARSVDVYVSQQAAGSPFAGGVWAPYVCFPTKAYALLSAEEREAVLAHELAHVRAWDPLCLWCVDLLADLVWFVPGTQALCRQLRAYAERAADASALAAGADRDALSGAVLKLVFAGSTPVVGLPFVRPESIAQRVAALLADPPRAAPLRTRLFRWALAAALLHAALRSTFVTYR